VEFIDLHLDLFKKRDAPDSSDGIGSVFQVAVTARRIPLPCCVAEHLPMNNGLSFASALTKSSPVLEHLRVRVLKRGSHVGLHGITADWPNAEMIGLISENGGNSATRGPECKTPSDFNLDVVVNSRISFFAVH